jgi:Ca-activated chloride channel family protein
VRGWMAVMVAALASLMGAVSGAQEAIRVDVNLVTVAFSVRDANGGLVDNLTKEDFEVDEDTVPQKIAYFARSVDVPLTLGPIVDASGSQEHFGKKHQHDLEVFLKDVWGPKDRVFLVGFGNHIRLVSDFSQSGAGLMEEWKRYDKSSSKFPELGPPEERDLGTTFYDSIYYPLMEKLATENGRRALLMFSDGEDNSSSHDMMTAIEAARGANVLVYYDSLYGEAARKIDGAESVRNAGDGAGGERDGRSAHRCGNYGSAHLFSADLGRVAGVV